MNFRGPQAFSPPETFTAFSAVLHFCVRTSYLPCSTRISADRGGEGKEEEMSLSNSYVLGTPGTLSRWSREACGTILLTLGTE